MALAEDNHYYTILFSGGHFGFLEAGKATAYI